MTKRKDPKDLKKRGRKCMYTPDMLETVRKLSLLGMTDAQMADIIEVSAKTFQDWKKRFPKFLHTIKEGKEVADSRVVESLYKKATGYDLETVKVFQDKRTKEIKEVMIKEHYPPDTTACVFWLKNRQPKKFRDKHEIEVEDKTSKFFKEQAKKYGLDKGQSES